VWLAMELAAITGQAAVLGSAPVGSSRSRQPAIRWPDLISAALPADAAEKANAIGGLVSYCVRYRRRKHRHGHPDQDP
jgi:hypothetical protein